MPRANYRPLLTYLTSLPAGQERVTLTFAELETLVGPLSVTARMGQLHWRRVVSAQYWHPHRWTAHLQHGSRRVTFTRSSDSEA